MKLYIVATPIGNLDDITVRALKVLESVDLILCEDTRQTKKLLVHYKITTPVISYHQHSKLKKIDYILNLFSQPFDSAQGCPEFIEGQGKKIALVSDAGTPGISDPGNKLINLAIKQFNNLTIIPIPGPCAAIAGLSISGFPTDKFVFYGFLPHKKGKEKVLKEIINAKIASVFYESPYRIVKTLKRLKELNLNKKMVVCRELTKKFETVYRGDIEQVLNALKKDRVKGEFVVIISSQDKTLNSKS